MVTRFTCPVDGTALVPIERAGIEIDHCPSCRGVWLDRGELDKIVERSAQPLAQEPQYEQPRYEQPHHEQRHRDGAFFGGGQQRHPHKRRKSFLEELFD